MPDFWDNTQQAAKVLKTIKTNKMWVDSFREIQVLLDDLETLHEFYEANEVTAEEVEAIYQSLMAKLEALEFKKMLRNEEDQLDAILEINPGAGGTESQDWAEMLVRMYVMWRKAGLSNQTTELPTWRYSWYQVSNARVKRCIRIWVSKSRNWHPPPGPHFTV